MKVEGPGGQSLYLVFVPKTLLPSCKSKLFRVHFLNKLEQRHRLCSLLKVFSCPLEPQSYWLAPWIKGSGGVLIFLGFGGLADSFKTDVLKFFISNYQ